MEYHWPDGTYRSRVRARGNEAAHIRRLLDSDKLNLCLGLSPSRHTFDTERPLVQKTRWLIGLGVCRYVASGRVKVFH